MRDFSPTCTVHVKDCEGWWLSGCRSSMAEHCTAAQARCPRFDSWRLLAFSLSSIFALNSQREAMILSMSNFLFMYAGNHLNTNTCSLIYKLLIQKPCVFISSLNPRLSILHFVSELCLQDKTQNGKPWFEPRSPHHSW